MCCSGVPEIVVNGLFSMTAYEGMAAICGPGRHRAIISVMTPASTNAKAEVSW